MLPAGVLDELKTHPRHQKTLEYVIHVAFPLQSGCTKRPHFYVFLSSPVLSNLKTVMPEYPAEEQTKVIN